VSLTLFVVTRASIRTSDASSGPRRSAFTSLRNAPLPFGGQKTDDGRQIISSVAFTWLWRPSSATCVKSSDIRHAIVARRLRRCSRDRAHSDPNSYLIARTNRHLQKALEFRFRSLLTTVAFSDIRADGFACPSQLIAQHTLFDHRKAQTLPMDFERHPDTLVERLPSLRTKRLVCVARPPSVLCRLSTVLRIPSFGSWLEPRYIFGAGILI
jgi:hypothetical protein